jgi:homoserine O-acetyltransferase/O-succinyltransferase
MLESGEHLADLSVSYRTFGVLNEDRSNVVFVLPALTATTDAAAWWPGMVGPDRAIDTERLYVICPRIDYEALYIQQQTLITTRDVVSIYRRFANAIGVQRIHALVGGSMGGQQVLEWAVQEPDRIDIIVTVASNAVQSPWGTAIATAQRMALEADTTLWTDVPYAGAAGLAAARAMGMIAYRTHADFDLKQTPMSRDVFDAHPAETYQRYQGKKLVRRFNARTYYLLTRTRDTHDVGRGRGGTIEALSTIKARTVVVGIDSDMLFPASEQKFIAQHIPGAVYLELHSTVGHDAFLADQDKLSDMVRSYLAP